MEEVPREELTGDEMNSPTLIIYRVCAYSTVVSTTDADFLYKEIGHHGRPSRFRQ